ncbi:MAG: hypothetical protein HKN43_06045 [Rhodothermales bacterium]|nr:hypothetical protein [Rhodothermales bacterium]
MLLVEIRRFDRECATALFIPLISDVGLEAAVRKQAQVDIFIFSQQACDADIPQLSDLEENLNKVTIVQRLTRRTRREA